jgi:beta-ribofuranosylaminobenzene 5'-phosphate synthase
MSFVKVISPSRLHFGLWSLGNSQSRQFGGVGLMIDAPRFELSIEKAGQLTAEGSDADRAMEFARRWAAHHGLPEVKCRLVIVHEVPAHAGLGSGTQLALSVAAGLGAFYGLPPQPPQELAPSVGRGLRSAVGTYGFAFGGLIIEQGKSADDAVSPLVYRLDVPDDWRFVLIRPVRVQGISGLDEATAFAALPSVPQATTERLTTLAHDGIADAVIEADFARFADNVYEYGRLSGECFAAQQGGPFNGPVLSSIVEQMRQRGYAGVGQSSWGPTIFVATPTEQTARQLVNELKQLRHSDQLLVSVAVPNNRGACIRGGPVVELPSSG